eukprot:CAMPEP_0203803274 /NCGR_PEP_ID=MMETSP0100_2-20121128/12720_1 /ASSEMBLY_ACC=CAM_ASM_000210 /TAXON_ID=96639 /ORGANISM=" , Strain NY0313808BC1" /LENGTH=162 /DNA_ID=CAMNT_0050710927 /DNA_START=107 /DNA_END=594 /DNA_ORIENTATION=-
MSRVVWRLDGNSLNGDSSSDGFECYDDADGEDEGLSFEEQLARLNIERRIGGMVQEKLDKLEEQLYEEREIESGCEEESWIRDGMSYALTTPASIEEWAKSQVNLRVRGNKLDTQKIIIQTTQEEEVLAEAQIVKIKSSREFFNCLPEILADNTLLARAWIN